MINVIQYNKYNQSIRTRHPPKAILFIIEIKKEGTDKRGDEIRQGLVSMLIYMKGRESRWEQTLREESKREGIRRGEEAKQRKRLGYESRNESDQ